MAREGKKTPLKRKIYFLVEGKTEKYFIKGLLEHLELKVSNKIENIEGGGYKDFLDYFYKNRDTMDIIIVVCDLDKANSNASELVNLERLIKELGKNNLENTLFMTHYNIETLFYRTLAIPANISVSSFLGYTGSNSKGKEDIFEKLSGRGFTYQGIVRSFSKNNLFYTKAIPNLKGVTNQSNLANIQTNFIYFKEYIESLIQSWE